MQSRTYVNSVRGKSRDTRHNFGSPRTPLHGLNYRLAHVKESYIKCSGCNELRDPHLFHSYNGKAYVCVYCIADMNNDLKEIL